MIQMRRASDFEIGTGVGDQAALQAQVADGGLQLGFRGFEVGFGGGNVRFYSAHVGLDASNISVDLADLLLLLLFQAAFGGTLLRLLRLQFGGALQEFFLGHARLARLSERVVEVRPDLAVRAGVGQRVAAATGLDEELLPRSLASLARVAARAAA